MTNTQTLAWLEWIRHLHGYLPPEDVQRIVELGKERDDLERQLVTVDTSTHFTGDESRDERHDRGIK